MALEFTDPKTLSGNAAESGAESCTESGTVFAPRFGPDGLIAAIASDATSAEVLMFAWMNMEALTKTLETGVVHYFSRSRQSLWKKGETSGEFQKLVEMRTDCDQDVVLLKVEQTGRGAACHTGRRSCFYRKVEIRDGIASLSLDADPPLFDPESIYKD